MAFVSISETQLESLKAALAAGQYNLLLGAGSSADALSARGPLPIGDELRDDLCIVTKASRKHSLQRIFALLNPDQVETHITQRFLNCKPGPTAEKIRQFLWRRIFTWNIDDVLENAYATEGKQKVTCYHYGDDYRDVGLLTDLQIVHLHGSVLFPSKGYVFSRDQYVSNVKDNNVWMSVLSTLISSEPMVISGTALDEVDLDYYLSFRSKATARADRGPSIFVTKDNDAVVQQLCEKHSLLHFCGYTEDFLNFCLQILPNPPTPEALIPAASKALLPPDLPPQVTMSFHADFELVPATANRTTLSRFQLGHEPEWSDLADKLDVPPAITANILVEVQKSLRDPDTGASLMVLQDDVGTGKTTVIRRVAFELAKSGITTLYCTALSSIDDRAAAQAIDQIVSSVVLVVDNIAEQAIAVERLITHVTRRDLVILGAARSYRGKFIDMIFAGTQRLPLPQIMFSPINLDTVIQKYFESGNVGAPSLLRERARFAEQLSTEPIAIACCRILNNFKPLDRIVDDIIEASNPDELDRYLFTTLAQICFAGGIREGILVKAIEPKGIRAQIDRRHPLPLAYSDSEQRFLIPQNATIAERVFKRLAENEEVRVFRLFTRLAAAIQPFVNRETVKMRTPEARLSGRLFDYDDVIQRFIPDLADEFYSEARRHWQWNSRYWEQLALVNLTKYQRSNDPSEREQLLDQAIARAKQAVAIELHPFGLTTLGKILMVKMAVSSCDAAEVYSDAFDQLAQAIEIAAIRSRVTIHPFITLLRGSAEFVERGGTISIEQRNKLLRFARIAKDRFTRDQEAVEVSNRLLSLLNVSHKT